MFFPEYRARRVRRNEQIRRMVRETSLSVDDLIYPVFVVAGRGVEKEISTMPGQYHYSVDRIGPAMSKVQDLGIPAVILFGIPEKKDPLGTEAFRSNGVVQEAIRKIKKHAPELAVITDVCLCEYTSHGHCGVVEEDEIRNDETLELLAEMALSHAKAGADVVAPSDMMDGRVGAIREGLDEAGFENILILSYAAKYASSFYGPFREAAQSTPQFGDRRSYQMDPGNQTEALREVTLDIQEGADIIMVKPALPYLDVISRVRDEFDHPVAAYQVSGEYAMIKAAAGNGWIDEEANMMESLLCIKRAGADMILTYFAQEAAKCLR